MTANTEGLASYIIQQIKATGGATVNAYGFSPADGYMVGGLVDELVLGQPASRVDDIAEVMAFTELHAELLRDAEVYVGAWLNPDTGNVHLDISERYAGRHAEKTARSLGIARDELAIYCLHTQESISLKTEIALKHITQWGHEGD